MREGIASKQDARPIKPSSQITSEFKCEKLRYPAFHIRRTGYMIMFENVSTKQCKTTGNKLPTASIRAHHILRLRVKAMEPIVSGGCSVKLWHRQIAKTSVRSPTMLNACIRAERTLLRDAFSQSGSIRHNGEMPKIKSTRPSDRVCHSSYRGCITSSRKKLDIRKMSSGHYMSSMANPRILPNQVHGK